MCSAVRGAHELDLLVSLFKASARDLSTSRPRSSIPGNPAGPFASCRHALRSPASRRGQDKRGFHKRPQILKLCYIWFQVRTRYHILIYTYVYMYTYIYIYIYTYIYIYIFIFSRALAHEQKSWHHKQTCLILPVFMCVSQRLSHARLSISFYTAKLRMAHENSYSLFDGHSYMDHHGRGPTKSFNRRSWREGSPLPPNTARVYYIIWFIYSLL